MERGYIYMIVGMAVLVMFGVVRIRQVEQPIAQNSQQAELSINSTTSTSDDMIASALQAPVFSGKEIPKTLGVIPEGMVSINFDDGFVSQYNYALPILVREQVSASFYIITRRLKDPLYMNKQQILELQAAGQEVGAHTRTHPHLSELTNEQQIAEVAGSKTDLLNLGIHQVTSFAYPYGDFNTGAESAVRQSFMWARSTIPGLNDENSNIYALYFEPVIVNTTFDMIKGWIDEAVSKKKWLILVFHRIDEGDNKISARHEILQQTIDYLKMTQTKIVSVSDVMNMIAAEQPSLLPVTP